MAKLRVSAMLVSQSLFRDMDKQPVICGASWDKDMDCVVLDIVGKGIPETDGFIKAIIKHQPKMIVDFENTE